MKVFMCRREGGRYSGGLVVVAANSKEEAFRVFATDKDYGWMVGKFDLDKDDWSDDITKWWSYIYPLENWFECKVLSANVDKPCIMIENGYTE